MSLARDPGLAVDSALATNFQISLLLRVYTVATRHRDGGHLSDLLPSLQPHDRIRLYLRSHTLYYEYTSASYVNRPQDESARHSRQVFGFGEAEAIHAASVHSDEHLSLIHI